MVIILRLQKSDFDQMIRSPLTLPSRGFPLNPRINTHYKEGSKDVYGTDMECIAVDLAGTDFYRPKGMTAVIGLDLLHHSLHLADWVLGGT